MVNVTGTKREYPGVLLRPFALSSGGFLVALLRAVLPTPAVLHQPFEGLTPAGGLVVPKITAIDVRVGRREHLRYIHKSHACVTYNSYKFTSKEWFNRLLHVLTMWKIPDAREPKIIRYALCIRDVYGVTGI